MKSMKLYMTLCIMMGLCVGVMAQDIDITKLPGYVNIEEIQIPDEEGKLVDISLGPAVLRLAKDMNEDEGGRLADFISGIYSVRVKAFDVDRDEEEKIRDIMDAYAKKMENDQWERLVLVKSDDERADIRVKFDDDKVVGIFLMAFEPDDEAVFINVVGKHIDLKQIGFLHRGFRGFDHDWFH